jgi:hypothetical protein
MEKATSLENKNAIIYGPAGATGGAVARHPAKRRLIGHPDDAEQLGDRLTSVGGPFADRGERPRAREHRAGRQGQHNGQVMPPTPGFPRIRQEQSSARW